MNRLVSLSVIEANMKTFIALLLALLGSTTSAAEVCPKPNETFAVLFSNGTLASRKSAQRSLEMLTDAVGGTASGQPIRYDLAYNNTDGAFADLLQSLDQQLTQFTSQTMLWLQGQGVIPGWFSDLVSRLLQAAYQINAPELQAQINKYQTAIARGQKVLVVSHSQGNVYVNQAKQLLQLAPGVDMRAFGIVAVATPANNVGGAAGPYFTNHRDIISFVPASLPSNWTLRDATGSLADSRDRVAAHSFVDTYMSAAYNVRDPLVLGIRAGLAALQDPQPVCDNYRKQFIGLLAGTYLGHCNALTSASSVTIDRNAQVSFPNGAVDLSGPSVAVAYVLRQWINTSNAGDNRGIGMVAGAVGGSWAPDGRFKELMRNDAPMSCQPRATDGVTALGVPVDIGQKAAQLMDGYRSGYVGRQCALINKATGLVEVLPPWQPVSISGGKISVGNRVFELNGARVTEFVATPPATSFQPVDYEPQFNLDQTYVGGGHLLITYKSIAGLTTLFYDTADAMFSCGLK